MNKEIPLFKKDNLSIHSLQKEDFEQLRFLYPYPLDDERLNVLMDELLNGITIGVYEDKLKGIIQLFDLGEDTYEIGYRTLYPEQNKGYMEKGVSLLMEYLKDTDVKRVIARVEDKNIASRCILRNNDFLQESYIDGVYLYSREWNRR